MAAETVPASLLVVGGGAIGLEIGQVMARFGARVTIVEAGPRLAGPEEPEASELITEVLRPRGGGGPHRRRHRARSSRMGATGRHGRTWPTARR